MARPNDPTREVGARYDRRRPGGGVDWDYGVCCW